MSRHVIATAFICAFLGSLGHAQQSGDQTPAPGEKPPSGPSKAAPSEAPAVQGQPVNVKIDLTITDQLGPGEPAKKTISMIVADRAVGSIRTTGNASVGGHRAIINIDANPQLLQNGNLKVSLGIEYNPRQGPGTAQKLMGPGGEVMAGPTEPGGSSLNQRVAIILEPGKPLVLSQAADPISDRKITVEIRATLLK